MTGPNTTVMLPELLQFGSMHAKLSLLTYPSYLRVVVSSANLTQEDWALIGQVRSATN